MLWSMCVHRNIMLWGICSECVHLCTCGLRGVNGTAEVTWLGHVTRHMTPTLKFIVWRRARGSTWHNGTTKSTRLMGAHGNCHFCSILFRHVFRFMFVYFGHFSFLFICFMCLKCVDTLYCIFQFSRCLLNKRQRHQYEAWFIKATGGLVVLYLYLSIWQGQCIVT